MKAKWLVFLLLVPIGAVMLIPTSCGKETPVGVEKTAIENPGSGDDVPDTGEFEVNAVSVDWGNNIVSEACYALSQARNGSSNLVWNGNVMGDWPYPWRGDCCDALGRVTRQMYGSWTDGRGLLGTWNGFQQGGECKFFVNLVLYRSSYGYPDGHLFLAGGTYDYANPHSWREARPGWVLQMKNPLHTAIVYRNLGNGLDVIDSNWTGGRGKYLISRHAIGYSVLDNGISRVYKPWESSTRL